VSELLNDASELLRQLSEQFDWSLNPDLLEVEVCRKNVRSSSEKNFKVSTLGEVCPLRFRTAKLDA
jgi:hypothetical protein